MTAGIELEVNRNIRRILVRHWIDLGRLSIRSSAAGRVSIYGSLQRIPGTKDRLAPPIVESIFNEIKRVRGVRMVIMDLKNWTSEAGRWRPSEKGEKAPEVKAPEAAPRLAIEDTDKGPQSDKSE